MRAAQKRAFAARDDEQNLYEQPDDDDEQNGQLPATDDDDDGGEPPTPTEPPPLEVLETADEDELRGIISNLDDTVEVLLTIPEWKVVGPDGRERVVQVLLRSLTSFERTQFIKAMQKGGGDIDFTRMYADLVILSTRHPKTKRLLFKNADRTMLNGKMGKATERIALRAADISGLSETALTDMRKNW